MSIFLQSIYASTIDIIKKYSVICLLFCASPVLAATYNVTEDGKGADYSAAAFNALDGNFSGDTFYFSGTFTTRIDNDGIFGTRQSPVVLDGYQAGDCEPLNSVCISSALLQNGMNIGSNSGGPDYVTIQDFRMTSSSYYTWTFSIFPDVSETDGTGWSEGITFRRNYIYNSYGEHAFFYRTKYLTVEDNKTMNFAQGYDANAGVRFNCAEDLVVRRNEFGHDDDSSSDTSANGVSFHGVQRGLFELNKVYGTRSGTCFSIKEGGFTPYSYDQDDIIVRFNLIYDCGNVTPTEGKGISVIQTDIGENMNIYLYANRIFKTNESGMRIVGSVSNIHAWSNIITDAKQHGLLIGERAGVTAKPYNIFAYNNTITRSNTDANTNPVYTGLCITGGTNLHFENNILWNNRPSGADSKYHQTYDYGTYMSDLEHNSYYNSVGTVNWYYDNDYRSLATMQAPPYDLEDDSPAGEIANPGFVDPDGADNIYGTEDDDYTLSSADANDAADLTACFNVTVQGTVYNLCYDDALDPNATNWKTTPPTVRTTKQGDHGAWERGAYVYSKDNSYRTLASPSNLKVKNVSVE